MGNITASPVDRLYRRLGDLFPTAELQVRKADDPEGFQFLNVFIDDFEVSVEWRRDLGFGISSGFASSRERAAFSTRPTNGTPTSVPHCTASPLWRLTGDVRNRVRHRSPKFGARGGSLKK